MGWLIAATSTVLIAAIWVRRRTLFGVSERDKLSERAMTVALLLLVLALFLMTPQSGHTLGRLLHEITGVWNLDTWIGDCLYMSAMGMVGVNVAARLDISDRRLRAGFHQRFALPLTAIVTVELGLLIMSPNASTDCIDMFRCTTDHWLDAYWTVMGIFVIWVLANTILALLIITRERRNQRTARVYLAACWFAASCAALRIITTWTNDDYAQWFWITHCAVGTTFAYAAGSSWRQKIRRTSGD